MREHTLVNNNQLKTLYDNLEKGKVIIRDLKNKSSILEKEINTLKKESVHYIFPFPKLGSPSPLFSHDKNKKQYLILGWYGASNYGDELMLSILLEEFQKEDAQVSVLLDPYERYDANQWVIKKRKRDGEERGEGLFLYYPPESQKDLELAADFYNEIIIGGGAHIDDTKSSNYSFIPFLATELSKIAIQKNKIVRWVAVSSNKRLVSKIYIDKLKFIAQNCQELSLRDLYSIETLKEAGIKGNFRLVEDLALRKDPKIKTLCFTLVDFVSSEFLSSLLSDTIEFITNDRSHHWRICFLPFFNGNHHDTKYYEEIVSKVNFKGIKNFIAPEINNVESMLLMINGADLFINMRYHASLITLQRNKPTLTICPDNHPHYFNKQHYIHEYFNNSFIIDATKYQKETLFLKLDKIFKEVK